MPPAILLSISARLQRRLVAVSTACAATMRRKWRCGICEDKRTEQRQGLALTWYALDDPNDPKLDELAQEYRLHPLDIEDCRSHNERVKSEGTDEYLFYILKYILSVDHGELTLGTISLFVVRYYFISVRRVRRSECAILDREQKA